MENKKHEKEDEFNLKNSRLKMLLDASEELIEQRYMQCREYLLIFVDTSPLSSVAGKELRDTYSELEQHFNAAMDIMEKNIAGTLGGYELDIDSDPLRGYGVDDYRKAEGIRWQKHFARSFHSKCWAVANEYELIPSQ